MHTYIIVIVLQAERQVGDLSFQLEAIQDRLEEAEGSAAGQVSLDFPPASQEQCELFWY